MTCAQTAMGGREPRERSFTGTALRCHFQNWSPIMDF